MRDASALACPVCGAVALEPLFERSGRDGSPVRLRECLRCAAIAPEFPGHVLAPNRQLTVHESQWPALDPAEAQQLASDYGNVVQFYAEMLGPPEQGGVVCEVGVGRGALLAALLAAGYPAHGCDPSERLVRLARGAYGFDDSTLVVASAEEFLARLEAEGRPVRAFLLWHVLEHLPNPRAVVRHMANILRPGGLLVLQVPLLARKWLYPEHLFFMTERALRVLAGDAGFTLARVDYDHERAFLSAVFERVHPNDASLAQPSPGGAPVAEVSEQASAGGAHPAPSRGSLREAVLQDAWIAQRNYHAAYTQYSQRLAAQEARLVEQETRLAAQEARLTEQRTCLAQRQEMAAAEARLLSLNAELAERDQTIEALRRALADRLDRLDEQAARLAASARRSSELEQQVAVRNARLAELERLALSGQHGARVVATKLAQRLGLSHAGPALPPPSGVPTVTANGGGESSNGARRPTARSLVFAGRPENRFWWHRLPHSRFDPPIYAELADDEWRLLERWYRATEERQLIGESAVPALCLLQALVMGNVLRNVVHLGVYAGYAALLTGFMMRRMGFRNGLVGIDIDPVSVEFTREWIALAGLDDYVRLELGDSSDPRSVRLVREHFQGEAQLVFIDSSHAYEHTLKELDLWIPAVIPGGFVLLHDTSEFAASFDATHAGGVHRAFQEWVERHPEVRALNVCNSSGTLETPSQVYKDGCGLGIIFKTA